MKYFEKCTNLEELRKAYKEALKKNHPDNGGSTEECAKINAEYKEAFEKLKNRTTSENKEKDFDVEADEIMRDILNKIISFDINIEIVGCWIWVDGNTYQIKDNLKELGFKWSNKRKKWHFATIETKFHKNNMTFEEIRSKYGSNVVKSQVLLA